MSSESRAKEAFDPGEEPALIYNPRAEVWKKYPLETGKVDGEEFSWVCSMCFEQWRQCNAPRHQMSHYYRYGTVQDCSFAFEELKTCMSTKFGKSEKIREEFAKFEAEKQKDTDPCFWELRTSPPEGFLK
eukprot:Nk52_evm2s351 gene=Nk52_evmTU2s351